MESLYDWKKMNVESRISGSKVYCDVIMLVLTEVRQWGWRDKSGDQVEGV